MIYTSCPSLRFFSTSEKLSCSKGTYSLDFGEVVLDANVFFQINFTFQVILVFFSLQILLLIE